MNRDYSTGESHSVSLFVGTEIEKTPAFGMRTLFVVGIQDPYRLLDIAKAQNCQHIYVGANQSFRPTVNSFTYAQEWDAWDKMVMPLLQSGIKVTVDFDVSLLEQVQAFDWVEYTNFIPMISVKLANISRLGYNASIKLDDSDFNYSNPGVWVHQVHDLMQRERFTGWEEYTQDQIIEYKENKKDA